MGRKQASADEDFGFEKEVPGASLDDEFGFTPEPKETPTKLPEPKSVLNSLVAAAKGVRDGGLQGYWPQLKAAGLSAPDMDPYGNVIGDDNAFDREKQYLKIRDETVADQKQTAKENPWAYGLGQVGGGIGSSFLIPGSGLMGKAPLLAKMGAGALTTALMNAAQNPGDEPGRIDPLQMDARMEAAQAPGMVADFPGGGSLESGMIPIAGPAVQKVNNLAKGTAERLAFKSLGPYFRAVSKASDKGEIEPIGRTVLDEIYGGARGWLPMSYGGKAERAKTAFNVKGQQIDQYINELEDASKRVENALSTPLSKAKVGINRKQIALAVGSHMLEDHTDIPGVPERNAKIAGMLDHFEGTPGSPRPPIIPLREGEMKKRAIGDLVKWDRMKGTDIPLEEQVHRQLYGKLAQGTEDAGTAIEKMVGSPDVGKFKALKESYGNLRDANAISHNKDNREFAKMFLQMDDLGMLGAGGSVAAYQIANPHKDGEDSTLLDNHYLPAMLFLGNRLRKNYGAQFMSKALDSGRNLTTSPASSVINKMSNNPWGYASALKGYNTIMKGDQ